MGAFIAIIAIGFLVLKSGILNTLGLSGQVLSSGQPAPPTFIPPAYAAPATYQQNQGFSEASGAVSALTSLKAVTKLTNAIPIIGPALGTIFQTLISAFAAESAKRAKEAISENNAVANAFPGWDRSMLAIQQAYNNGGISRAQAFTLVDIAWQNYWNEVTPQIQPGRNGCAGGTMSKTQADQQFPGLLQCSGSWGAACCVGYADLANGAASIKAAITQTDNTGSPAVASIPAVYASKYGGANRASYTLTFIRPTAVFSL
jgi:hypothetical protein